MIHFFSSEQNKKDRKGNGSNGRYEKVWWYVTTYMGKGRNGVPERKSSVRVQKYLVDRFLTLSSQVGIIALGLF